MTAFVTHPSVRIRGTENNYEPVLCVFPSCADRPPHMHCPFCVKTEVFQDHAILKAHYRVKHVDKGLEFAGLRILRCCDHCDIVGTIKGEKKFKGPHWHCYKCRNGFNRRDEAIKHYRTHFRNPQTTFQIQVTQEVNVMLHTMNHTGEGQDVADGSAPEPAAEYSTSRQVTMPATRSTAGGGTSDAASSSQASVLDAYYASPGSDVPSKSCGGGSSSSIVAANETIDSTVADSSSQAILIVDDRGPNDDSYAVTQGAVLNGDQLRAYEDVLRSKMLLEKQVHVLEARIAELEAHVASLQEPQLQSERAMAKTDHSVKDGERTGVDRPLPNSVDELFDRLQRQHRDLLVTQLEELKTAAAFTHLPSKHADVADDGEIRSAVKRKKI